jgi:cell division protein ZipA
LERVSKQAGVGGKHVGAEGTLMDLGLREWIMWASAVLMGGVIAHALWLRWRSSRNRLKLEIDPAVAPPANDVDDLDLLRGELPNGGARVVPGAAPRQGRKDRPPVLMAQVEKPSRGAALNAAREPAVEPSLEDDAEADAQDDAQDSGPPLTASRDPGPAPPAAPRVAAQETQQREPMAMASAPREPVQRGDEAQAGKPAGAPSDGELIVMQVISRGDGLDQNMLVSRVSALGLHYGDFNIFHRYKGNHRARKCIQFSMANAVEPGVFDLSGDAPVTTRGVAFFMQLPLPPEPPAAEPLHVFDDMLHVAQEVAAALDGELLDERHSVMTTQTIEHCRERIRDFTRRQQIRN